MDPDAFEWQLLDKIAGRRIMVDLVDVSVVDVEQQVAVGGFAQVCQKFCFAQRRVAISQVGRNVFHQQAQAEKVLHMLDATSDVQQRFLGIWQWQQVMILVTGVVAETQMIRYLHRFIHLNQVFDGAQVGHVQWLRAAERHTNTVKGDRVVGTDSRPLPRDQATRRGVIIGQDLEPGDWRAFRQYPRDMRAAQPQARACKYRAALILLRGSGGLSVHDGLLGRLDRRDTPARIPAIVACSTGLSVFIVVLLWWVH